MKFPWKAPPVSRYGKVCCNNLFVSLLGFIPKREGFAVANKKNALQKWKKRTLDIYNYLPWSAYPNLMIRSERRGTRTVGSMTAVIRKVIKTLLNPPLFDSRSSQHHSKLRKICERTKAPPISAWLRALREEGVCSPHLLLSLCLPFSTATCLQFKIVSVPDSAPWRHLTQSDPRNTNSVLWKSINYYSFHFPKTKTNLSP